MEKILEYSPTYVGTTATTISVFNAAKVAEILKSKNPKIIIIHGGPHLTAVPEETMEKIKWFDVGVIGEGEDTIVELLESYESKKDLANVKGLIIRDNEKLKFTSPRPFIKNLYKLPLPAWDLLPDLVRYYQPAADSLYRFPAISLVTSRGCPGKCIFCDRSVFGNVCRSFSAEYVIKMMRHLHDNY